MPPYPDLTTLTFLKKQHEYAQVYSYYFESPESVVFTAGSYAHVRLLSLPETVRRVRELSFASSPQDDQILFGIDGSSGSDYQRALQSLESGDSIEIFKIKSHMTWPISAPHVVMIAGGVGITPFRSMLRDTIQKNSPITTTVLHVGRDSFLYRDELSELASEYKTTNRDDFSRELDSIVSTYPDAHYYVAGSLGFVGAVIEKLTQRGVVSIETDEFKGLVDDSV